MSTCRLLIPATTAPLGASQYGIETAAWGFRQVSARQSRNLQNDVTCPTGRNAPQVNLFHLLMLSAAIPRLLSAYFY